jgi:hypothetical protein
MNTTTAYRGTTINEAHKLLQHKPLHKATYRITNKAESLWYARSAKRMTSAQKWSIIEASLAPDPQHLYEIKPESIDLLYQPDHDIYKDHIGVYHTDQFDVYHIPAKFQSRIHSPKIIEII